MSGTVLAVSAALVFVSSGLMAMAGIGAAFLFVPLFYYLGVPLAEAASTALLLNVVSLVVAAITYWRAGLVDFRVGLPMMLVAVTLSPLGARTTAHVNTHLLLALFAGFLVFAGTMMLFHNPTKRIEPLSRRTEITAGVGVGGTAGFLGGMLGVGGGNFILPALNWMGFDAKVAAGTTSFVVVFASFAGFLGHATMGGIDPTFATTTAVSAAAGSAIGSHLMRSTLSSAQLKKLIGALLWLIAVKMIWDLLA